MLSVLVLKWTIHSVDWNKKKKLFTCTIENKLGYWEFKKKTNNIVYSLINQS